MKQYLDLMRHVRDNGTRKEDRTGTGTVSVFGHQLRFDLGEGFPLVTTKKVHLRSIIHELLWFLKGDTNIRYLHDNNVTIWDEWADDNGDLGPVYGSQWRSWPTADGRHIDQISQVISQLRSNPVCRRHSPLQSGLLLSRRHGNHVPLVTHGREFLERQRQHRHARPVIHRLAGHRRVGAQNGFKATDGYCHGCILPTAAGAQYQSRRHANDTAAPRESHYLVCVGASYLERAVVPIAPEALGALLTQTESALEQEQLGQAFVAARQNLRATQPGQFALPTLPHGEVDGTAVVRIYQTEIPELASLAGVGHARSSELEQQLGQGGVASRPLERRDERLQLSGEALITQHSLGEAQYRRLVLLVDFGPAGMTPGLPDGLLQIVLHPFDRDRPGAYQRLPEHVLGLSIRPVAGAVALG